MDKNAETTRGFASLHGLHRFLVAMLVILAALLLSASGAPVVRSDELKKVHSWDFDDPQDYVYDHHKLER